MADTIYYLGTLNILIGSVWLVVVGFQQSRGWGFTVLGGVFFCPILWIVFAVMHWEESKMPVIWMVLGTVLASAGLAMGSGNLREQTGLKALFSSLEEVSESFPAAAPDSELPEGLEIPAIGGPLPPSEPPPAAPVASTPVFTPPPAATPVFTPPPAAAPPPPAAAPVVPAQPAVATPAAPPPVGARTGEVDPRLLEPADLLLSEAEKDWNSGRRRRAIATMKNALAILKRHLGETDERVIDLESRIELAESQIE